MSIAAPECEWLGQGSVAVIRYSLQTFQYWLADFRISDSGCGLVSYRTECFLDHLVIKHYAMWCMSRADAQGS